jgi:L-fucose mutarotase
MSMLKGIDPLLSPDLLKLLAEMGHDDAVVLADANFTAMSLGAGKPVLRLPGVGMARTVDAVASVLPLAEDVPHPVAFMQVGGTAPGYRSALQRETLAVLARHGMRDGQAEAVERFAFYERVKQAYAIVVTGELEPWGNFLLRKGVLGQTLRP